MFKQSIMTLALAGTLGLAVQAQAADDWYPSKYGPDDQAGSTNLMTPERALAAVKLIKQGIPVPLARTYEADMPLFGQRVFAVRGTSGLAGGPFGDNKVIWMDDFLATEIGQVGTQFDGLGHIGVGGDVNKFYNGLDAKDVVGPTGLQKLGMEHAKPFFTRGIVLDMVGLKGRNLELGEEILVADIEAAIKRQKLKDIQEGDVVLFHTGWGSLWMKDNDKFNSGEPGIGIPAAEYLVEKGIAIVGADTWATEVVPNPDPTKVFAVHQILIPMNGVYILENAATERLVDAGVSEFAFIYNPLPVKGATGAPGNALAVY
jgi:kynurenine formamidase